MKPVDQLLEIKGTFEHVKMIGDDGVALAKITARTLENMKIVINMFEKGMQSEEWSGNFQNFAGSEGMQLANKIYTEFKGVIKTLEEE